MYNFFKKKSSAFDVKKDFFYFKFYFIHFSYTKNYFLVFLVKARLIRLNCKVTLKGRWRETS